ncbi:MAG: sigma-70 family RNA polymerase sigma factor [Fimbriimonadaceae bacterium]|nr:sigma-70 family RNA polymerase sigma factor [Fimbriimonadaceae bacterium]
MELFDGWWLFAFVICAIDTIPQAAIGAVSRPADRSGEKYAALAKELMPRLLASARRLTSDSDKAQDLVQDALIKGFEAYRAGNLELTDWVIGWFIRVMSNAHLNSIRRETRRATGELTSEIEATLADSDPKSRPDHWIEPQEQREALARALATLSEDHREVIVLVDLEELSYDDAAATLGVPVGTVRSRLNRARYALADAFRPLLTHMEIAQ